MANKKNWMGILVVMLAMEVVLVGCDTGSGGGENNGGGGGGNNGGGNETGNETLSGTWIADNITYTKLIFSGNSFTLMSYTSIGLSGTVSGATLIPTGGVYYTTSYQPITGKGTATLSGGKLTVSGFDGGCKVYIHGTYTKQN
jgi:hypothetical protein